MVGLELTTIKGDRTLAKEMVSRSFTAAGAKGTNYTVNSTGTLTGRGTDSFGYDQANRLRPQMCSHTKRGTAQVAQDAVVLRPMAAAAKRTLPILHY